MMFAGKVRGFTVLYDKVNGFKERDGVQNASKKVA